jgi:flagellar motor switch protein FliN/FliY
MTTPLDTHTMAPDTTAALAAATAAAAALPSVQTLTVAGVQTGTHHVTSAFQGAVVAQLSSGATTRIGILVGEELVAALAASPIPGLQLAHAVQPAIDAAAAALGTSAEGAVQVELSSVAAEFGEAFTVVLLMGAGLAAAVLVTDDILTGQVDPGAVETPPFASLPIVPPPSTVAPIDTSGPAPINVARRGIEMLHGVDMELTVELGRTRMAVRDLLALSPGDVLELDRAAGSPADLLVNGRLIARGEVVVVDEDFGLRITQILDANAG